MRDFYGYLGEILRRALFDIPELVSSNWVAVLASVVAFAATFLINVRKQRSYREAITWRKKVAAMRVHWIKNAVVGAKVTIWIWVALFAISLMRVLYLDHEKLTRERDDAITDKNQALNEQQLCAKDNTQLRSNIAELIKKLPQPESPDSLRRRTIRLVSDLNLFWSRRPAPQQAWVQNPSTDDERKRNAAWTQYERDAKTAYLNANYRERLAGIVREFKNKGIPTGFMEQAFDQQDRLVGAAAFGGWQLDDCFRFMNDLCQLRELAYHVDANDRPIFSF